MTDDSYPDGKIKYKSIADSWDRDHVCTGTSGAQGKTKQGPLKWDAVVAVFNKANDPKYKRTIAERTKMIVNADNTGLCRRG